MTTEATNGHLPLLTHRGVSNVDSLRAALDALAELLSQGEPLRVSIERGGMRGSLEVQPVALTVPDTIDRGPVHGPASCEHWLWLTPTERAILDCFGDDTQTWKSSECIGAVVNLVNNRDLSAILRNMVERNILEAKAGRGFRLVESKP